MSGRTVGTLEALLAILEIVQAGRDFGACPKTPECVYYVGERRLSAAQSFTI
jgi:hypothetical protein